MTRRPIDDVREESTAAYGDRVDPGKTFPAEQSAPSAIWIPTEQIALSRTNPRKHMDEAKLIELVESVRRVGVLQPILVRPLPDEPRLGSPDERYELVAGERRLTAARRAELVTVPAVVRELTDLEVLEIQLVENLQRADLHPLEEAEGYQRLHSVAKLDVARIAEKVGRSPKYIYDRIKLLALIKELREHFLEGRITAGHAILLARLKPADQKRVMETDSALFQHERLLWHPDEEEDETPGKVCSVRELEGWIDEHVRFDVTAVDPVLFPETASELERARKVVAITYEYMLREDARSKTRTYGQKSWKRADGQKKSKTCEHSVTGFVAAGPARGEAFAVCVAKDKCTVHWSAEIRARAKRAKAPKASAAEKEPRGERKRDEELEQAISAAQQEAYGTMCAQAVALAKTMKSDEFLRVLLSLESQWELRDAIEQQGTKLTIPQLDKWIDKASPEQMRQALAYTAIDRVSTGEIAAAFDINWDKMEKEAADRARAAIKAERAQTSAKPKSSKKKGRK